MLARVVARTLAASGKVQSGLGLVIGKMGVAIGDQPHATGRIKGDCNNKQAECCKYRKNFSNNWNIFHETISFTDDRQLCVRTACFMCGCPVSVKFDAHLILNLVALAIPRLCLRYARQLYDKERLTAGRTMRLHKRLNIYEIIRRSSDRALPSGSCWTAREESGRFLKKAAQKFLFAWAMGVVGTSAHGPA